MQRFRHVKAAFQQGSLCGGIPESYVEFQYAAVLADLLQKAREEGEDNLVEEIVSEMVRVEARPSANPDLLSKTTAVNRVVYSLPPPKVEVGREVEEKVERRVALATKRPLTTSEGVGVVSAREQNLMAMERITQSMKESMGRISHRIRADEKRLEEAQGAQNKNFDAVGSANKANMRFLASQKLQIFAILKQLVVASLLLVLTLYLL